jgi:hypothetical protein
MNNTEELNQYVESIINKILEKHNLIKSNSGKSLDSKSIDEAIECGNETLDMINKGIK